MDAFEKELERMERVCDTPEAALAYAHALKIYQDCHADRLASALEEACDVDEDGQNALRDVFATESGCYDTISDMEDFLKDVAVEIRNQEVARAIREKK